MTGYTDCSKSYDTAFHFENYESRRETQVEDFFLAIVHVNDTLAFEFEEYLFEFLVAVLNRRARFTQISQIESN